MSPPLPTIVVVPGAWHSPFHYKYLISSFEIAGYPTSSSALPSFDPEAPYEVTLTDDAVFIRQKLLDPLLDEGKHVVLVMH